MVQDSVKSPLMLSIGGVGLVAMLVVATSYWRQYAEPAVSAPSAQIEAAGNDVSSPTTDPWEQAMAFGWQAAVVSKTAKTQTDWRQVGDLWLQAVAVLELIPQNSENYAKAQAKVQEYLANFDEAEARRATAPAGEVTALPPTTQPLTQATAQSAFAEGAMAFSFTPARRQNNGPRVVGRSADDLATLELIGPPENLTQATLMVEAQGKGSPSMAQMVYISHFLSQLMPEETVKPQWVLSQLKQVQQNPRQPITIDFGPRQVTLEAQGARKVSITVDLQP